MGDLKHRGWIVAKGIMFILIVLLSGAGIILQDNPWLKLALLMVCLWAACRFYYFLFYVLEHYVGMHGPYTGILDLCQRLWRQKNQK
jgi:hypothetical protein